MPPAPTHTRAVNRTGLSAVFGAYLIWGLFPLYFVLTAPATALEVVAWRVIFSLIFCGVALVLTGGVRGFVQLMSKAAVICKMLIAGLLIGANWFIYVVAVTSGNTLEASLGYFINPLVSVLLGVIVLGERLRRLQWLAVTIAVVAVASMGVLYGSIPWLSLGLAFSFGFYGLAKSRLGKGVSALNSLTAETVVLLPIALVTLGFLSAQGALTFTTTGAAQAAILVASGIITAVPLLLFAVAATHLPLSVVGIAQYATPLIQFLIALLIFGEEMSTARWVGFIIVWCAVLLFIVDALSQLRLKRVASRSLIR